MLVKSSPPQQNAVVETWTAEFLVLGQALYHWAILVVWLYPPDLCLSNFSRIKQTYNKEIDCYITICKCLYYVIYIVIYLQNNQPNVKDNYDPNLKKNNKIN